jgi:hypothetical protein
MPLSQARDRGMQPEGAQGSAVGDTPTGAKDEVARICCAHTPESLTSCLSLLSQTRSYKQTNGSDPRLPGHPTQGTGYMTE